MKKTNIDKKNKLNLFNLFLYITIFFYAVNFLGIGELFPLLLLPYFFKSLIKLKFNYYYLLSFMLLLFFTITYGLISYFLNNAALIGVVGRIIYPIMFLTIGTEIFKNNIKMFFKVILTFITGLTIYGYGSLYKTSITYGGVLNKYYELGDRNVISMWDSSPISATALTAYMSFALCLSPLIFNKKINLKLKILITILFIMSLFTVIQVSSRTGVLVLISSILISILFSKYKFLKFFIFLFSIVCINLFLQFLKNIPIIQSYISLLIYRIIDTNLSEDSRLNTWLIVLKNLAKFPLGGKEYKINVGYAHNLWLDIAYSTGIIPFLLLAMFTIVTLIIYFKFCYRNKDTLTTFVVLLFPAFYILFMLEPIFEGIPIHLILYCFFIGGLTNLKVRGGLNDKECKTSNYIINN